MNQTCGYGLFSKLPYELREQIWLEFLPVGRTTSSTSTTRKSAEADLRVLRVSRDLYAEISNVLYAKTCLHFNLSPSFPESPDLWCTVSFKRCHNRGGTKKDNDGNRRVTADARHTGAVWRLESNALQIDARFNSFPFSKIATIEVSLSAPDPKAPTLFLAVA
ncbi:hypothetical protein AJ80_08065 [Polytolypa hystricis UAMH7299]|uniref:2EXR domain-containing protein n=1 Tax=Polytolypa hystricis (strain UAMH7299) TaxID=1447883 RepID=A0A2B7XE93_POLH7|nr:hypothetical protein AJ80_08065 [Polytolypa hystricis UAMH7299]